MKRLENLSRFISDFSNEALNRSNESIKSSLILKDLSRSLQSAYTTLRSGKLDDKELTKGDFKAFERLENQLLDAIIKKRLYSNFKDAYYRAWYRCERNAFLSHLLSTRDKRDIARPILIYSLRTARKYQFTGTSLRLCQLLKYDAGFMGRRNNYKKYARLQEELTGKLVAEMKGDELFYSILLLLHHKYGLSGSMQKTIVNAFSEIKKLLLKYKTHSLKLNYWRMAMRYFIMKRNPSGILKIYNEFTKYIRNNPHLMQVARIAEFSLYGMDACLELRDLKRGKKLEEICHIYSTKYTGNWYVFMEVLFILALHSRDYSKAYKAYISVTKSSLFRKLDFPRIEKWNLFNAYLNFVSSHLNEFKKMSPLKLINNLPSYSMDKRGFNFPVLIAEFICILIGSYHSNLIDFKWRFSLYLNRYVSRKKHYRTWYFSKLILLLYKYEFDPGKCEVIGRKYYKKLSDFKVRKIRDYEMIEIVPYEHLWSYIINFLKQKDKIVLLHIM